MPKLTKEISAENTQEGLVKCRGCGNLVDSRGLSAHFITCPGARGSPVEMAVNLCWWVFVVVVGLLLIPFIYAVATASYSLVNFLGVVAWKPLRLVKIPTAFMLAYYAIGEQFTDGVPKEYLTSLKEHAQCDLDVFMGQKCDKPGLTSCAGETCTCSCPKEECPKEECHKDECPVPKTYSQK
jgi:hypothetical protein